MYLSGDFSGARKSTPPRAAASSAATPPSGPDPTADAQPSARAAADSHAATRVRRRGCRAGARQQQRRQGASGRQPHAAQAARSAMPKEDGVKRTPPLGDDNTDIHEPTTPSVLPPPHHTHVPPPFPPQSTLSALASSFLPPPPPPPQPSSSIGEEAPIPPDLLHLLPHACLSFEEQRWDHYISYGGPFPPHGSSKKRLHPPSPAKGSPSSFVVGCVVNERRARTAVPPPTPRLPPSREG